MNTARFRPAAREEKPKVTPLSDLGRSYVLGIGVHYLCHWCVYNTTRITI